VRGLSKSAMKKRKARVPGSNAERGVTAVSHDTKRAPKLPHERDESTDAMASAPRKRIKQAHDDLERGLVDTDRGPVIDATYRKLKQK
jgi:hypothetical protein